MERRAYYNFVQIEKKEDPDLEVENWQVMDYRSLPQEELFSMLEQLDLRIDKAKFIEIAQNFETPQELVLQLCSDSDQELYDRVYLICFELWRRFLGDKLSLPIFCDELDYQISLYIEGEMDNPEGLEDVLANLEMILEENSDEGVDPKELFGMINENMANDLEAFLYDFISEQIDNENNDYAQELLEAFGGCIEDGKWFELLRLRLLTEENVHESGHEVKALVQNALKEKDLEFDFELLSMLVQGGDLDSFHKLSSHAAKLLQFEEDFQELLAISVDFYSCLDMDEKQERVASILNNRKDYPLDRKIDQADPDLRLFLK